MASDRLRSAPRGYGRRRTASGTSPAIPPASVVSPFIAARARTRWAGVASASSVAARFTSGSAWIPGVDDRAAVAGGVLEPHGVSPRASSATCGKVDSQSIARCGSVMRSTSSIRRSMAASAAGSSGAPVRAPAACSRRSRQADRQVVDVRPLVLDLLGRARSAGHRPRGRDRSPRRRWRLACPKRTTGVAGALRGGQRSWALAVRRRWRPIDPTEAARPAATELDARRPSAARRAAGGTRAPDAPGRPRRASRPPSRVVGTSASLAAIPGRLEVGDAVEDGAVQRRQILGARVWLHRAERWPDDGPGRNSPAVPLPRADGVSRRDDRRPRMPKSRRVPVAALHVALTRSTSAPAGPTLHRLEQRLEVAPRPLRHAADRSVQFVRDPARQPEVHPAAKDEVSESDALDPAAGRGLEADLIRCHAARRSGRGQASARSSRTSSGETFATIRTDARPRRSRKSSSSPASSRRAIAAVSSSRPRSRMDRSSPRRHKARSRATSVQSPMRASAARRRSVGRSPTFVPPSSPRSAVRRRRRRARRPRRPGRLSRRPAPAPTAPSPIVVSDPARSTAAAHAGQPLGRPRRRAGRAASRLSSSRTRRASGWRAQANASPGRPAVMRASRLAERGVGHPMLGQDRLDVADADRPESQSSAARSDRRQERLLGVRAEDERHPGGRLLQGLEQGRLGVLVHALGRLDDGHPCPALDGQQRQVGDEITDPTDARTGAADDHLATRSLRADPMEIRVPTRGDQPAGPARSRTGAPAGSSAVHSEPGRQIQRERRLADAGRADEQHRVRRPCRGSSSRPRRARPVARGSARRPSPSGSGGLARARRGLAGRPPLGLGLGHVLVLGGAGRRPRWPPSCGWSVAWAGASVATVPASAACGGLGGPSRPSRSPSSGSSAASARPSGRPPAGALRGSRLARRSVASEAGPRRLPPRRLRPRWPRCNGFEARPHRPRLDGSRSGGTSPAGPASGSPGHAASPRAPAGPRSMARSTRSRGGAASRGRSSRRA